MTYDVLKGYLLFGRCKKCRYKWITSVDLYVADSINICLNCLPGHKRVDILTFIIFLRTVKSNFSQLNC